MMRASFPAMLVLAALHSMAAADDSLPPILREVGIDQRLNEQVPQDVPFRDDDGRSIHLGDCLGGKPVILVLAYYRCPMLCTQVLNGLVDALREISLDVGDEFNVVTVSFDARETYPLAAAKKSTYVEQYGRPNAAAGWHFLTGSQESIDRLTEAVGFRYRYDPRNDQFAHASGIMVLTPTGKIARYFYGIKFPARDLRLGLVEASENKIGTPVDRVLLFCYHYDPATGKYSATAMGFVRLGGILTVAVLGTLLLLAWRRDWLKSRSAHVARVGWAESSRPTERDKRL
jgi:protein SCO1/2